VVTVFDQKGRFRTSFDGRTTMCREADWVIAAIGQIADRSFLEWASLGGVTEGDILSVRGLSPRPNIVGFSPEEIWSRD
jgi:hypothetical protein